MSDIFLSYKSEDRARAQMIAGLLEQQGWSVWWDRIILPGETFDDVIEQKLDEAKCIIVLWSKMSIQSNWVKTEATEGNNRGILFPVLIEDVKVPLAFRRIQAANLVDWQGIPDHPQFQLLLRSVTEILGHPSSPPEKPKKEETPEETETFTNSIGMEFVLIPAGEFMMVSVV